MGKALITNKIYLEGLTKTQYDLIVDTLTYKLPKAFNPNANKYNRSIPVEVVRNYKLLPKGILAIPQPREDLIPAGFEVIDRRIDDPIEFPEPIYDLYDNQKVIYDQVDGNCIINAVPGWGKTFTGLHIAKKLGRKTLIIVHTLFLRDQWVDSIRNLLSIEPGIISSGKVNYDSPITVSNIQTLSKHLLKIHKEFGLVINDEAHHCPASTFTSTLSSFHAKYKIGLSATLQRKDHKQILFKDAFGSKVLVAKSENIMKPSVQIIESNFYTDATLGWSDRVTKLCNDLNYRKFIADIAKVYKDKGHSLLILGDRTEFLYAVGELLGDEAIVITGQTKDREGIVKDIMSGKYKYTVASTKIFAEGISVNILSALILTGPINNDSLLEQIIGRIQRNFDGKLDPVIIDINFCGYADRAQNESRLGFYMRKGWDIQTA